MGGDSGNGKSNALRLNDKRNGLQSYYWGNDLGTGPLSELTVGVHTATVQFDGTYTRIFLDGKQVAQGTQQPDTLLREITIGATNMHTTVKYMDNYCHWFNIFSLSSSTGKNSYEYNSRYWLGDDYRDSLLSKDTVDNRYGKPREEHSGVGYNTGTNITDQMYHVLFNTYKAEYDHFILTHNYTEFLNSSVYSVRIYKRALTNAEITYNYITDYYRFESGA